mmetsp:Transcript_22677/g.44499  ORF Transcript_22677/g.44499 Transcript_22677/m.44499 type:complete len:240 (-) Transcript_22677:542-1261(-)
MLLRGLKSDNLAVAVGALGLGSWRACDTGPRGVRSVKERCNVLFAPVLKKRHFLSHEGSKLLHIKVAVLLVQGKNVVHELCALARPAKAQVVGLGSATILSELPLRASFAVASTEDGELDLAGLHELIDVLVDLVEASVSMVLVQCHEFGNYGSARPIGPVKDGSGGAVRALDALGKVVAKHAVVIGDFGDILRLEALFEDDGNSGPSGGGFHVLPCSHVLALAALLHEELAALLEKAH